MLPDAVQGLNGSARLIDAINDVFDVDIDQKELESITTVAELSQLLAQRHNNASLHKNGLTRIAYYRVLQALNTACEIPLEQIAIDARMEDLLPEDDRRRLWAQLQAKLEFHLPDLLLSAKITSVCKYAFFVVLSMIVAAVIFQPLRIFAGIASAIWIALFIVHQILSNTAHAKHVPANFATVNDIVQQVITWKYGHLSKRSRKYSEEEIFAVLKSLITYIHNVSASEIATDTTVSSLICLD